MMKCAVDDHPLVDGVLVEDKHVVSFIRKRVADFRTMEEICRICKDKIMKIYREKMKRAIALKKASLNDRSLPTISSSSSSQHASVGNGSYSSIDDIDRMIVKTPKHSKMKSTNKTSESLEVTASSTLNIRSENIQQMANSINKSAKTPQNAKNTDFRNSRISDSNLKATQKSLENENEPILGNFSKNLRLSQQPTTSKAATSSGVSTLGTHVTTRKRTIPDYLKAKTADTNSSKRICLDTERPTTSKAAAAAASASTKRPITDVINIDEDDDEPRYSLNAFNGTRLPNIQPMPPKRKPRTDLSPAQLAMIEYARDVTGGGKSLVDNGPPKHMIAVLNCQRLGKVIFHLDGKDINCISTATHNPSKDV